MKVVNWLIENKEWVFSGIGILVLGGLFRLITYLKNKHLEKKAHAQKNNSLKGLKEKAPKAVKSVVSKTVLPKDDSEAEMSSTVLFDYRIRRQFPGVRGVKRFYYNRKIGNRLCELLLKPSGKVNKSYFWWFRGSSNMHIRNFSIIDRKKCLMDCNELKIYKIYVYISETYWRDFIYVITQQDKQTGLYKYDKKIEGIQINEYGNYYESFGVYGKKKLTRHEYEDGAYEKNGKLIQTDGSEQPRWRYLAPYNFLICAHDNPINSSAYDKDFKDILNGILEGEKTVDDIVTKVEGLPKRDRDY